MTPAHQNKLKNVSCTDGEQFSLGAKREIVGTLIYAIVLREGGLNNFEVTMISTLSSMSFMNWQFLEAPSHRPGKDKLRILIRINFDLLKRIMFYGVSPLICRTARQYYQSWFILRMSVDTSTVIIKLPMVSCREKLQKVHITTATTTILG